MTTLLQRLGRVATTTTVLRIPVVEQRQVDPTACLTFLGIELGTLQMICQLPSHKLEELKELVVEWLPKRSRIYNH